MNFLTSRYTKDPCSSYGDLKDYVDELPLSAEISCNTFSEGIMKQGLFLALTKFVDIAVYLADKMIYYNDEKTAKWMLEDGLCVEVPGMSLF